MSPSLSVVADHGAGASATADGKVETMAQKVRRLQAEAKGLAREHVQELQRLLIAVERTAGEVSGGGEAYPSGVRELARQLAEDTEARLQTLSAIISRSSH